MSELLRESPAGQLLRYFTGDKFLKYAEEKEDFNFPSSYAQHDAPPTAFRTASVAEAQPPTASINEKLEGAPGPEAEARRPSSGSSTTSTEPDTNPMDDAGATVARTTTHAPELLSRITSRPVMKRVTTRKDLEQAYTEATMRPKVKTVPTQPIIPEKTGDGTILVDWYDTDDQDNPQNWSFRKKCVVATHINAYTLAVYLGSAIFTPSEPYVEAIFGVKPVVGSLGLALYVLGYGTGPLIFSPLSEIPVIGRNPPYMVTFAIFVILCVPTALVNNIAGLLVLRFLQGFFGSPCLATGGASIGDIFSLLKLPYGLSFWSAFATCGPALGPIISGFSVPAENWRWSIWEMLWLAGPVFVSMFFLLPETSSANILVRRAKRLRKLTGNPNLKAQAEIDQATLSVAAIVHESLYRPFQIMLLDPAVLFTNLYTALVYGIYYSFFEAFPLVYINLYGFNLGEMGLTFLSISIAVALAIPCYCAYTYYVVEPEISIKGLTAPERRLIPALFASFLLPVGLFLFGWTSRTSIHWIASVMGIGIYVFGVFILLQSIFVYIPMCYPQYSASLFAGNDFARSAMGAGAVLFSRPLYINLGIGPGISLMAGLTCGCVGGIFLLYYFGAKLRARSSFAAK